LHISVGAVDKATIADHVGDILQVLAPGAPRKAFLVRTKRAASHRSAAAHPARPGEALIGKKSLVDFVQENKNL
jgi:hypothetical protein